MSAREAILGRIRTATGRPAGDAPPVLLHVAERSMAEKIREFRERLEALAGRVEVVATKAEARAFVDELLRGKSWVATDEAYVAECGFETPNPGDWREMCATRDAGITSARWALAATGTLVMVFDKDAPRLASLLPPLHVAIVPVSRMLFDTQEWMTRDVPDLESHSSVVLITGPSRTADIEQILVRGVHGPKELVVVLVEGD
jgi:L-lactate dehydrogenase complex protein LldG